jgi:poly-beta-hydroxybutyrate-responsive repressor
MGTGAGTHQQEPERIDEARPPRDLILPYLLLLIRSYQAHGYLLLGRLAEAGFGALDPGWLYRTLRQMEKDGLVTSAWDTASAGPARRVYSITEAGQAMLDVWAAGLQQHRRMLDGFIQLYGAFTGRGRTGTTEGKSDS